MNIERRALRRAAGGGDGENSLRHWGTIPENSPTRRLISSTRVKPFFLASSFTMLIIPSVIASSCIYLSRQLKHGSMLATISPASATVLFLSMKGTVGVFLKLGTWMDTRWLLILPSPTTM